MNDSRWMSCADPKLGNFDTHKIVTLWNLATAWFKISTKEARNSSVGKGGVSVALWRAIKQTFSERRGGRVSSVSVSILEGQF